MRLLEEFFRDIDQRWCLPGPGKVPLRIIGSTALMLRTDYARGTKDSDVIETGALSLERKEHLLVLAGKESELARRHRLYIDVVRSGLPFLPQAPVCQPLTALNEELQHLELEVLDVVDVVVSKLKPFRPSDRADIRAMADRDLIDPARLLARFREAVDFFLGDGQEQDIPRYIRNLNTIQRDDLDVPETPIEAFDLPDWI